MKIYFDTNIYAFASVTQEEIAIRRFLDTREFRVVVSLGNVLERLAIREPLARAREVAVIMTLASLHEREPISWRECEELRIAIAQYRPNWLRHAPSRRGLVAVQHALDGHRQLWADLAQMRLPNEAAFLRYHIDAESGSALSKPMQQQMRQALIKGYDRIRAYENTPTGRRWIDDEQKITTEYYWRTCAAAEWRAAIVQHLPSLRDFADWLNPYLKEGAFLSRDYFSFWLEDLPVDAVPRTYLPHLVGYYQLQHKITHGNAGDLSHASHVLDVDRFVTADKDFHAALDAALIHHFPHLPRPILIDRGSQSLLSELQRVLVP